MLLEEPEILSKAMKQFREATNLTDKIGVLSALTHVDTEEREEAFDEFYNEYKKEPLVIDKWFSLLAISSLPNTFEVVKSLLTHPQFDLSNPNKTRALIGTFAQFNYLNFHDTSGLPYAFLGDLVLDIDAFNPQLAARLVEPLIRWQQYDQERQQLMRNELERIANAQELSSDVYEMVSKSLEQKLQ